MQSRTRLHVPIMSTSKVLFIVLSYTCPNNVITIDPELKDLLNLFLFRNDFVE